MDVCSKYVHSGSKAAWVTHQPAKKRRKIEDTAGHVLCVVPDVPRVWGVYHFANMVKVSLIYREMVFQLKSLFIACTSTANRIYEGTGMPSC